MPAGNIPIYGPFSVPAAYNTCLLGSGTGSSALGYSNGGTQLVVQPTVSNVDVLTFASGSATSVCASNFVIGPPQGTTQTAGALIHVRYRIEGTMQNVYALNAYDGIWIERGDYAVYNNIGGSETHEGLKLTCNGVGFPTCQSSGTFNGGHWVALSNSATNIYVEAPTTGVQLVGIFTQGGANCVNVQLVAVGTQPLNEIMIESSILDGCGSGVVYSGNSSSYVTNYVMIQNNEINTYNVSGLALSCENYCQNVNLQGNVIGGSIALGPNAQNITIKNNPQIDSSTAIVPYSIATQSGGVSNIDIIGNTFGPNSYSNNCIALTSTPTNVTIQNNNLNGCNVPFTGAAGSGFTMLNNPGVDNVVPSVASATALTIPLNPSFTLTGTAAPTSLVVPFGAGAKFTFRATASSPGIWTAGGGIGNTFTPTSNVPINCYWDGTSAWCK